MATPEEQAVAIQQLNVRLKQQETAMTILAQERERLAQQVHSMSSTPRQRVQAREVDTRVIGKPDQFDGDPMKYADWWFKLRSYLEAVDQRYQMELTKTEASSAPRLNANLRSEESALSTQMYYILLMTTARATIDKCHNASVNEGFVAWRQFVMEWEPILQTRNVGLLMTVLVYRFRDDTPTKLAAFEKTVHDNENQSTKTVDDDIKIGVTMLGMEDMRVKEHLIQNSVRITSWNQMREEILEITRTQQYIDSQPMPMQLGANPKSKGKRKESKGKGKGKGHQGQRQGQGCEERTVQESEKRRSEKVLLLQQNRSHEGRVQTETERPCRGRGETSGSVATFTRRNSDRTVTVLTPRRETLVNVCHSHALREQRNVLRVFQ